MMDFIKKIEEARMTKTGAGQRKLTYTDCTERLYLSVLILELARRYPKYNKQVRSYADSTARHKGYDVFRLETSDLYNFIFFVAGPEEAQDRLQDPSAAKRLAKTTTVPTLILNRYLEALRLGKTPANASHVISKLETGLKIQNNQYKDIRRGLSRYAGLSDNAKKELVTTLLFAARAKLRSSDIISLLEKLAIDNNLETSNVIDTEPTTSVPDLSREGRDIANYRYLVGTKNVAMVKKFLDQARTNSAIPSNMLKAYLPAIRMIDNIVKGGPAFIQQLKLLEDRAKKSRK